ncbi:hypothetical protein LRP88_02855 [Fusarium phalaenopsidis]
MSDLFNLDAQRARLSRRHASESGPGPAPTLPPLSAIKAAEASLPRPDSETYLQGVPQEQVLRHITEDIVPACNGPASSSRYYGFVTGGTLPIAEWADNVVSRVDQNVQVHLPTQTVATTVEDAALEMLAALLGLTGFRGRTFTTGATASNVLGLACGREAVVGKKLAEGETVGGLGLLAACMAAGIKELQILTSAGHSSLSKAASVVGFGRASVKELRLSGDEPWRLDIDALERELQREGVASVIALSAGEVNTAFGIFARALPNEDDYKTLHKRVEGLELADSITVDGHKLLNVPYDCGMFLTRTPDILQSVFTNPNAAYLSSGGQSTIPSPLNIGLENSRRFRALPAYAVLLSEGRPGIASLLANMVTLSRRAAAFLRDSEHYELLPDDRADLDEVFMIVLFRAKDPKLNAELVEKINGTRQMYVSGTSWKGEKAVRVAVSNWMVDVERDFKVVTSILTHVAEGKEFDIENC